MELPSMVQRSGDTLIVRSVVSGNQLYMDQPNLLMRGGSGGGSSDATNQQKHPNASSTFESALLLEQQLACIKRAAQEAQTQQIFQQNQQQQQQQQQQQRQQQLQELQQLEPQEPKALQQHQTVANLEMKDDALPQCKIKRNYSCNYCTYFTQNPRYHLTHLRDVHGEKIVINKCQLCLYASRHYQKLVRHMRMVHGCTDGASSTQNQNRGKRGAINRESRKRKIDQTNNDTPPVSTISAISTGHLNISDITSLEQVKNDLERQQQKLQRDIEAFNKQQEEQKQQQKQQINAAEAILVAAYEQQMKAQQEYERETRKALEQFEISGGADAVDSAAPGKLPQTKLFQFQCTNPTPQQQLQPQPQPQPQQPQQQISLPPPPQQRPSFELTPSPSGSASSPSPTNHAESGNTTPNNLSTDEPSTNRLLKCSLCDYTTLYRSQLDDHERQDHSNTKLYHCSKCQYVTHLKARFSKHVKYHSMPMIKCVTCDFRTPYKWNLDRHMKNHGGAGPFKCAACDFTADIKQSLTVHEMNHHVPPVGHAAGMTLARRRNKVGGTDLTDDFFTDSADLLDDHFNNNNNNLDEYDDALEKYDKRLNVEEDEPTDLSQKGGSSDTSSIHNQSLISVVKSEKLEKPTENALVNTKTANDSILNLSKDLAVPGSSLTEIASLFFSEKQISELLQPLDKSNSVAPTSQLSPIITNPCAINKYPRKSMNFFDKLKSSSTTNENLICPCGHLAKCLSESIIHRKTCNYSDGMDIDEEEDHEDDAEGRLEIDFTDDDDPDKQSHSALNLSMTGSTRCQYCRHRCKSSVDLLNHLKNCIEANSHYGNDSFDSSGESTTNGSRERQSVADVGEHPLENKVFIWNKLPVNNDSDDNRGSLHDDNQRKLKTESRTSDGSSGILNVSNDENSYYGVETAPGYGEVTKKMTPEEEAANSSLKKVYKCPHCSFWASTASRFHVHIVGHLNKKPFECSLCSYRSNWRWDITKHIRLKTIRDPSHKNARVLMNDETGRRNYTKYNKYITLMKVTEEDGDPKLMKSGEMTPNQVASLSFINDYNKHSDNSQATATATATVNQLLNGMREDITLEPLPSKNNVCSVGEESDNYIKIPLLASMMNAAAMAQQHKQQQLQQKDQNMPTLITPSVTISPVKKSPSRPNIMKSTQDFIVQEFHHENGEKKAYYKCRKCSFRNPNRDIVWSHAKNHADFSISTGNATSSPKASISNLHEEIPMPINSNLYINKVLAMYLGQQQQEAIVPNSPQSQNKVISSSDNSPLSGLAMALTGKSTVKTVKDNPNILEYGVQKLNTIEASATNNNENKTPLLNQTANPISSLTEIQIKNANEEETIDIPNNISNLEHLLTSSPKHLFTHRTSPTINNSGATIDTTSGTQNTITSSTIVTTFPNSNLTISFNKETPYNSTIKSTETTKCSGGGVLGVHFGGGIVHTGTDSSSNLTSPSSSPPVLTFKSLPIHSHNRNRANKQDICNEHLGNGDVYDVSAQDEILMSSGDSSSHCSSPCATTTITDTFNPSTSYYHHSNNVIQNSVINMCHAKATKTASSKSAFTNLSPTSASIVTTNQNDYQNVQCNNYNNSNNNVNGAIINNNNNIGNGNGNNSNHNNNNNNNNNSDNNNNRSSVLTNDSADRREPSPYRCGHCHQVSNWKHVIQRHCRLKHAGDIRIETLDRLASSIIGNDRTNAIYKPLNDVNHGHQNNNQQYNVTLKALQQQTNNNNGNGNSNNTPLFPNNAQNKVINNLSKVEAATQALLNSPLTLSAAAAANAANTPQDLQAAAVAYLAAAYKAATTNPAAIAGLPHLANSLNMAEELILQHQLQHNDQIEVIRVPSNDNINSNNKSNTNDTSNMGSSNLAQLLENVPHRQHRTTTSFFSGNNNSNNNNNNNKSKQQKCPFCTYICESKSQMNYHISLHKPTQYECPLCTFVCAKKQHLSNHMRTIHQLTQQQQQQQQQQQIELITNITNQNNLVVTNNSNDTLNMDFSMALQLAAAKTQIQDPTLAIDLTNLNPRYDTGFHSTPANTTQLTKQMNQESQLPPEYQYRMIYYCSKCPARYAQKHNDTQSAKINLEEHMQAHASEITNLNDTTTLYKYQCEYCDFTAPHETLIQAHRYVHSTQYQDKCNKLFKNCKEDIVFRAPKLMKITTTKKSYIEDTIWIVDNELNNKEDVNNNTNQQQQQLIISSSSKESNAMATVFEGGNSLLKKQLESRQAPSIAAISNQIPNLQHPSDVDDSCSNAHSISASVATSEAAEYNESNINSPENTSDHTVDKSLGSMPNERCQYCPYESNNMDEFKDHQQHHICVTQQRLSYTCEHCDYTSTDQQHIEDHTQVHFNSIEKLKQVDFFTSYDKLELSMEQENTNKSDKDKLELKSSIETLYGKGVNIKKEVQVNLSNNDNSQNTQEEVSKVNHECSEESNTTKEGEEPTQSTKCNKIILYKSDGGLSIKKELSTINSNNPSPPISVSSNSSQSQLNDNISDRLRKKMTNQYQSNDQQQYDKHQQSDNHKTILVNAKTGQVISRN